MYVKEDLIIPQVSGRGAAVMSDYVHYLMQHYSFYDFIINKARGKSGPLFSFDVHEDVRLVTDANVEKDEVCSHTVLIVSH